MANTRKIQERRARRTGGHNAARSAALPELPDFLIRLLEVRRIKCAGMAAAVWQHRHD